MCARYTLRASFETMAALFELDPIDGEWTPRYNVAPTDLMPVVVQSRLGARQLRMMKWGLVPNWAKDERIGVQMLNARSDTVFEKPAFREAIRRRRCLVPADGFYEWQDVEPEVASLFEDAPPKPKGKPRKQPYHITVGEGLFAFAGIYEKWTRPSGEVLSSYSILTGPPNELVANLHDRAPLVVRPEDYAAWLDRELADGDAITAMMAPFSAQITQLRPVDPAVGNVRNDYPELLAG